jgi:hypothetical protein
MTTTAQGRPRGARSTTTTFKIPAGEFRSLPIAGSKDAHMGMAYVRVLDVPAELGDWMGVNPRMPKRGEAGLAGPVPKAILRTLEEAPEDMALKNIGIYILVESAEHHREKGGEGVLTLTLSDKSKHGIVNGGHTFYAIREAIDDASTDELSGLQNAYVRLHVMRGVPEDKVVEIAEGLNRSKQVQNPSLQNLRGNFESIRSVMEGHPGADQIAYHEGDVGNVYIGEIISLIEMYNFNRYDESRPPTDLYARQYKAIAEFADDVVNDPVAIEMVTSKLPDILVLADKIRRDAPNLARTECSFEYSNTKVKDKGRSARAGSEKLRNAPLYFLGPDAKADYRLHNGWLFPMLAAFRANVKWDTKRRVFSWKVPNDDILENCLVDLVRVCVQEHRDNNNRPEWVGKRESAYRQCALYVELYLAKLNIRR